MKSARKPENEQDRLSALRAYELLDTEPEAAFEAMTRLAAIVFDMPIAAITLVDENRQWFKSQFGLGDTAATGRDVAFCAHTILESTVFEVDDASADPRFADNPLVTGDPHVRFYAGMPLIDPAGMPLGAICVLDRKPRQLTPGQRENLRILADVVVGIIQRRIRSSEFAAYRRTASEGRDLLRSSLKERSDLVKDFALSINLLGAILERPPTERDPLLHDQVPDWAAKLHFVSTAQERTRPAAL